MADVVPNACLYFLSYNACKWLRRLERGALPPQLLDYGLESRKWSERADSRFRTASACGFTPLSIIWMQVASVSLSSFVFKSCEISYRAAGAQPDPGDISAESTHCPRSPSRR